MQARLFAFSALLLVSTACTRMPVEAYRNPGQPESLLDVSSEVVTVQLASEDSINEITNWMETDQPSRAELHCSGGDPLCAQAEDIFKLYSMDYQSSPAAQSEVYLVYERVTARDCENRYIDNSINPYNLHPPTFGCSIVANMVQMAGDKRQLVNPALLDFADAQKLVTMYNAYINPTLSSQTQNQTPVAETVAQQAGSGGG